jgi:hypothetical protein
MLTRRVIYKKGNDPLGQLKSAEMLTRRVIYKKGNDPLGQLKKTLKT